MKKGGGAARLSSSVSIKGKGRRLRGGWKTSYPFSTPGATPGGRKKREGGEKEEEFRSVWSGRKKADHNSGKGVLFPSGKENREDCLPQKRARSFFKKERRFISRKTNPSLPISHNKKKDIYLIRGVGNELSRLNRAEKTTTSPAKGLRHAGGKKGGLLDLGTYRNRPDFDRKEKDKFRPTPVSPKKRNYFFPAKEGGSISLLQEGKRKKG